MNVNETIEIMSLVSRAPKDFKLAMASRRAVLSGNTSLTCLRFSMRCIHRTNRRAIAMMFICPSVWVGRVL